MYTDPRIQPVVSRRMAIRFIIHWGDHRGIDWLATPFAGIFKIYPSFGTFERLKYHADQADSNLGFGGCMQYLGRESSAYHMLEDLCHISTRRLTEPDFDLQYTFVPLNIHEIHIWSEPDMPLPWMHAKPKRSRLWRQTPPLFLENIPHTIVYHGEYPSRTLCVEVSQRYIEYFENEQRNAC